MNYRLTLYLVKLQRMTISAETHALMAGVHGTDRARLDHARSTPLLSNNETGAARNIIASLHILEEVPRRRATIVRVMIGPLN